MDKYKCKVCGKSYSGEDAKIHAERCAEQHERVFISVMDFELAGFINWVNSRGTSGELPKGFLRKLHGLEGRALRG